MGMPNLARPHSSNPGGSQGSSQDLIIAKMGGGKEKGKREEGNLSLAKQWRKGKGKVMLTAAPQGASVSG